VSATPATRTATVTAARPWDNCPSFQRIVDTNHDSQATSAASGGDTVPTLDNCSLIANAGQEDVEQRRRCDRDNDQDGFPSVRIKTGPTANPASTPEVQRIDDD
jgi:hypothetical protein